MPVTLIEQKPTFTKKVEGPNKLAIAEMFADTLQGEGLYAGTTATFIRMQGCTLKCVWCDTLDVWPEGNEYSFDEIFELFESIGLIERLLRGQHLILTGGSPLKQQDACVAFIKEFIARYGFKPFIEVENEAVLMPSDEMIDYVDWWNNSPKLANSGMKEAARVKPFVLQRMGDLENSSFKFVVNSKADWEEIENTFINPGYVSVDQILLMPEGQNQVELSKTRELVADIAIEQGVMFSDRLHITIWDKKTGV